MIRLICADVDGTLVGADGSVHPEVWPAVARVREAGIRLAICSGRPAFGLTRDYAERFDPHGWHIFQNGSSVMHFGTAETRSARLTPETVKRLVKFSRLTGRDLELYSDHSYAVESVSERVRAHAALLGTPFVPRPLDSVIEPVVRGQWLLPREEGMEMLSRIPPGFEVSPSTSPLMTDTLFVSLMPPGVNKGTGVSAIADAYGIRLDRVMFVGDGWNDAPALRLVGYPVAMENAEPEAREIARHFVGHVDDGGLAEALDLAVSLRE